MKFKRQFKHRLVRALRDGSYQKAARNTLRIGDTYSLAGVICDLSGVGTWVGINDDRPDWVAYGYQAGFYRRHVVIPRAVRKRVLDMRTLPISPTLGVRVMEATLEQAQAAIHRFGDHDFIEQDILCALHEAAGFPEIADFIDEVF